MPDVICNTSPLQYLHQIGKLSILPALVGSIVVPPSVLVELDAGIEKGLDLPQPEIQGSDPLPYFASVRGGGGGANKTQIVYSCNPNFHTVVPYIDILIKNGLAERIEGRAHPVQDPGPRGRRQPQTAPLGALEIRAGTKRGWGSKSANECLRRFEIL